MRILSLLLSTLAVRARCLLRVGFAAACLVLAGVGDVLADEEDYPCLPEPSDMAHRVWGIQHMDPEYPVEIRLGHHEFRVPYAYFTVWQTPERINCHPDRDSFGMAFWMPDLRAPQQPMWGRPQFRIQEEGRPAPGEDEFIVIIPTVEIMDDEGHSQSSRMAPSLSFSNFLGGKDHRYRLELVHNGLIHVVPVVDGPGYDEYVDLSDGIDELRIDCAHTYQCWFDLYLGDHNLGMRGTFPKDALPYWREIKIGIRTLLEGWMVQ